MMNPTHCGNCASRGGCSIEPIPYHCDYFRPDPRRDPGDIPANGQQDGHLVSDEGLSQWRDS